MNIACQNKIEEIIDQVIAVFLEENLKQEGMVGTQNVGDADEEDDEDENFDKKERTVKSENLDFFSRLMKQKLETSMNLMINFYNQILSQYQVNQQINKFYKNIQNRTPSLRTKRTSLRVVRNNLHTQ